MKGLTAALAALVALVAYVFVPIRPAGSDADPEFVALFAPSVPAAARPPIQAALAEWSARLSTEVPVMVEIVWEALPPYVAGACDPLGFATDPQTGFQIPIALANARAGSDLNPNANDIRLTFSNRERWHYDTTTPAPAGTVDVMSFTLHEIGHGIGFYSASRKQGGTVVFGSPNGEGSPGPTLLDSMLVTRAGTMLVDPHPVANVIASLRAVLRNDDVIWAGSARDAQGQPPTMSSGAFEPHSSLMHLDEETYPAGHPDALMTTMIRRGETTRAIGPAALGIMRDLGWKMQAAAPGPVPAAPAPTGSAGPGAAKSTATTVAAGATEPVATPGQPAAGASGDPVAADKPRPFPSTPPGQPGPSLGPSLILAALVLAAVVWWVARRLRSNYVRMRDEIDTLLRGGQWRRAVAQLCALG